MSEIEIITIGTELLLGAIQDTNTAYIAHHLNDSGFEIHRATIVGDNPQRIAQAIRDALSRSQGVITTGGLGPTVDDPTREAVALAFDVELEFRSELWQQISDRFNAMDRKPTENNRKQAFLPKGAKAIVNPVGTAPAFIMDKEKKYCVSLPGVPAEMKHLLQTEIIPRLQSMNDTKSTIIYRVIHTAGIGESALDEMIADLETLPNPTVGLSAHPSQVDIRVTAKAENKEDAAVLINPLVKEIANRLNVYVYGYDQDTLIGVVENQLKKKQTNLSIQFSGLPFPKSLIDTINKLCEGGGKQKASVKIGLGKDATGFSISMKYNSSNIEKHETRRFIQHESQFERWCENVILNFIRENISF